MSAPSSYVPRAGDEVLVRGVVCGFDPGSKLASIAFGDNPDRPPAVWCALDRIESVALRKFLVGDEIMFGESAAVYRVLAVQKNEALVARLCDDGTLPPAGAYVTLTAQERITASIIKLAGENR